MGELRPAPWEVPGTPEHDEAMRLADAYENGASVRALVTESGRPYGSVHRRLASFVEFRRRGPRDGPRNAG